jgi:hypothetical protein
MEKKKKRGGSMDSSEEEKEPGFMNIKKRLEAQVA